ncbi:protein-arginine deiminase domain-containing protein [Streptomyces sp. HU2014]|uniref:protein-arginine deiminase domain-containing protein n=1 Tax=Streptomyces sp. HU2014 TaxID=2939414 RepID=UPI0020101817|nr:protein-arginine deiminase domain-containing protein [Streptomyces sp. HU2014]UQI46464.1 protein-arginine deiminase domain-containing protein [Streptomyces sp. HU2014]
MTRPLTRRAPVAGALACAALVATLLSPGGAQASAPIARPELRTPEGTTVLPNLDDDARRCTLRPGDLDRLDVAVDERLAACNDAADEVLNGAADAEDLTPLRVMPMAAGDRAEGRVSLPAAQRPYARVFVVRDGRYVSLGTDGRLDAGELRRGVRLAVEARDIVRDRERWDGRIEVTLAVTRHGTTRTARADLRVAPVLLQHDLQRAQHVFASAPGPGEGQPVEVPASPRRPGQWREFADSLREAAEKSGLPGSGLRFQPGTAQWWRDVWRQDIAEPGYVTRTTPHGRHTLRILLRSPNYWTSADGRSASLRRAGRLLYQDLRGPGVGVVQQYTPTARREKNVDELLNFTGNFESLPPYAGYPQGRVVHGGSADRRPDPSFVGMLNAQGQQPAVVLDTSWLLVGHVDETVHVVRADNARGWTLAVSDPRAAVALLERARRAGEGGQRLFAGTVAEDKPTVDELLRHERHAGDNEDAARHIDGQLAVLLRETGLKPGEIVRLPVLYYRVASGEGLPRRHLALSPALANGLSLTARDYAAPTPHGPRVAGRDLFRAETERALAAGGVRVHWVEDFSWAHLGGGEVHCATNALREIT